MRGVRAFVAGATGFTGRAVVAELARRQVEVRAHVRPDSHQLDDWRQTFGALGDHVRVDTTAWEEQALIASLAADPPGVVFALLGTTRARASRDAKHGADSSYEAIDYGLTAMLRRACEALEHPPRFVYLSSMGVREGAAGSYLQARWKVEQELQAGALPYVIARPSFITGERDESRPGERIGSAVADGLLGVVGALGGKRLADRYRSTDDVTLARALVSLALDPDATGTFASDELQARGRP